MPYRNYAKPATTAAGAPEATTNIEGVVVKNEDQPKTQTAQSNGNGESAKELPAWLTKIKEGGVKKIPKDVQKRRRNFRLKKMLTPKPPMMVLFELVPHTEIQFENFIADPMTRLLRITARYDGRVFEGIGPSKSIAKNICSEQILQHIAFKSCQKDAEKENPNSGSHGEEETPWTALASIALFKLFNDWQSQGVQVPQEMMRGSKPGVMAPVSFPIKEEDSEMKDLSAESSTLPQFEQVPRDLAQFRKISEVMETLGKEKAKPKVPAAKKALPENPTSRHPVQLLNEMEGQLAYETQTTGAPPHVVFQISVTLNDKTYSGSAKNKKDAKKYAAQAALAAIYNVIYPDSQ